MEARPAHYTALTNVLLKRKDDVSFMTKLADETSGHTELALFNVMDGRLQHCSSLPHQLTLLYPQQVIHGEDERLLHQVNRKLLELSQHSV